MSKEPDEKGINWNDYANITRSMIVDDVYSLDKELMKLQRAGCRINTVQLMPSTANFTSEEGWKNGNPESALEGDTMSGKIACKVLITYHEIVLKTEIEEAMMVNVKTLK
jgi:hypothetical protein